MCSRTECIDKLTKAAPYLRQEFGVESLRLFGSMARGDNHSGSDVDICVDMPAKAFKLIELKNYLQDILGVAVDIIRRSPFIDSFMAQEIEKDGIVIFS